MAKSTEDQLSYQKGYQAGRKKTEKELSELMRLRAEIHDTTSQRRKDRAWQVFTAVYSALIATPRGWELDGKPVNGLKDRAKIAWRAVRCANDECPLEWRRP